MVVISSPVFYERWYYELFRKKSKTWGRVRKWWIAFHYFGVIGIVGFAASEAPDQAESIDLIFKVGRENEVMYHF